MPVPELDRSNLSLFMSSRLEFWNIPYHNKKIKERWNTLEESMMTKNLYYCKMKSKN